MDAEQLRLEAEQKWHNNDIIGARGLLEAGLIQFPSDQVLKVRLAELLSKVGEVDRAWQTFAEVALTYASSGPLAYAVATYKLMLKLECPAQVQETQGHPFLRELSRRHEQWRSEVRSGVDIEIPLFQGLPGPALEELIESMTDVSVPVGGMVFRQGEPGSSLFIVTSGYVQVLRRERDGTVKLLARLGPGDFFGEWSLLTGEQRRHATVRAETRVELLQLSREMMARIVEKYPGVRDILRSFYQKRRLDTLLSQIFPSLTALERRKLAEQLDAWQPYSAGSLIVQEGDSSAFMSIIATGKVDVFTQSLMGEEVLLATLGPGQFFGENSALTGAPRSASVRARTDVVLHNINREGLVEALIERPDVLQALEGVRGERLGATLSRLQELDDFSFGDFPTDDGSIGEEERS